MPRWNHAYTLAFSIETDKEESCDVSDREILSAILLRLFNLVSGQETCFAKSQFSELNDAVTPAYDTYEITDEELKERRPEHEQRPRINA